MHGILIGSSINIAGSLLCGMELTKIIYRRVPFYGICICNSIAKYFTASFPCQYDIIIAIHLATSEVAMSISLKQL